MRNIFIILLLGILGFSACERETEIELNPVAPMGGEWWVVSRHDNGSGVLDDYYGVGHFVLLTSNTAANTSDEILVDDRSHFWNFKVKTGLSLADRTFSVTASDNLVADYPITVNITNGHLIEKGGISRDGNVCDSIYMEVEFSDDPGTIYHISGVRRTGFLEDEW